MRFLRRLFQAPLSAACIALAGCDGIATGEQAGTIPLTANAAGGFEPVAIHLTPEMSPVAFNFRAEHGDDPAEVGKWNSYRATLSRDGQPVASSAFSVNHTGSPDAPAGAPYLVQNLFTAWPDTTGVYTLEIVPAGPLEVTLTRAEIELRRNVRGDDNLRP